MSEENTTQDPGLILPDDAAMADRVTATDRLLSFDAAGNPVTATASQLREYTAAGLATTEAMTAALAGKFNIHPAYNGNLDDLGCMAGKLYGASNAPYSYYPFLSFGHGVYRAQFNAVNNQLAFRSCNESQGDFYPWVNIWHSGNFDPATTVKTEDVAVNNGLNAIPFFGSRKVVGLNVANVEVSSMLNMEYANQIVQLKITDYLGQLSAHIRGSNSRTWRQLYHSGNLNPATAASVGLMSAEDKIKLNSVASALSLPVQAADTPATLSLTDEAIPETVVTPEISVRAQRAAQYQMQADELLYDALESFARNHPEYSEFAAWLEAKDRIRQELPKPQEGGGE